MTESPKAKLLHGSELALYIKKRQAKQVRSLKQSQGIHPKLVIVRSSDDPVITTYVRLKKQYGSDIGIEVGDITVTNEQLVATIQKLNADDQVHGVIVQLPLADSLDPTAVLHAVSPEKDVDALGNKPVRTPATPLAIQWLLAGLNITTKDKKMVIVGNGRLVGAPLYNIFSKTEQDVSLVEETTENGTETIQQADIVISATGVPGLLTSSKIKKDAVVIDAGTTAENGSIVGDAHPELYERSDIKITPQKGGIGPLTVCALFDNVILSAQSNN